MDRFLRGAGKLDVPVKQQSELVEQLATLLQVPREAWPDELSWQDDWPTPQPLLRVVPPSKNKSWRTDLECRLEFIYGDWRVEFGGGGDGTVRPPGAPRRPSRSCGRGGRPRPVDSGRGQAEYVCIRRSRVAVGARTEKVAQCRGTR